LYVAETNRIVRYAYKTSDARPSGEAEVVVAALPSGRGHFTRDLVFSPDGKRMYVAVGSASNVAEDLPKKSVVEAQAWEAEHGLGAAWGYEADRAAVLEYEVGSDKPGKTFATGIRNCVSLALQPKTNDLWCTTNERDLLGDDLVPDYSTRVKQGSFYGWPWYYLGNHQDPRLQGDRPDLAGKVTMPDVLYQAHSAALNLTFYTSNSNTAFPSDYVGDAFVALHGSWNRSFRTGYKIVRVRMKNGKPIGGYEDFMTGFIVDDGNVWGRPVATTVLHDGSLLVSDDGANQIYRGYYQR
jgi:glucose/arabinose dehydrogenase